MDWVGWSRAGWKAHLPGAADVDALVLSFGEATIHGLAHATAAAAPGAPAVRIGDVRLTHGSLDGLAARAAAHFAARIQPGDRVLIAAPVSEQWIGCYLGVLRAGGVAVLANPAFTAGERDELASIAEAKIVLAGVADAIFAAPPEPWTERATPGTVALLAFTSGTTGKPKGVPLTHRNLLTSIRGAMAAWSWSREDVLVHALPLFHQHGLGGLHATLIAGSSLGLLPRFDPEALRDAVQRQEATVLFAVPSMYQRLEGLPAFANRLRLCISGSAPLSPEVAKKAERVLGRTPLVRYGLTESGLDVSQVYGERHGPESVGVPLPGLLLRLGEDGEVQMRGPQVFGGYWRDPDAGSAGFTADGWFRTGDVGRVDEPSGELVLEGRTKEIIITGGLKVMPREVELVLERHRSVAEAAVAGLPSERWGEQVTAWVVVKPGETFDAGELIRHVRSHLAPYKTPKAVFQLDALPRNHVGKIDRKRLTG